MKKGEWSYRSADERALVKQLRARGWVRGDRNGQGHIVMTFPASGGTVPVPGTSIGPALRTRFWKRIDGLETGT